MGNSLNGVGSSNAGARVAAGDVDKTSSWSFSAADGNALLGSGGDDWANYAKWHLGVNTAESDNTKARWSYPFGKGGKVYRSGVIAIKQRASAEGDSAIAARAASLLDAIDKAVQFDPKMPIPGTKASGTLNRAWATFEIKSIKTPDNNPDGEMTIEGIASTPNTDRMGDQVNPMGAKYKLPMPLLYQHNTQQPIGQVVQASPTPKGIPFTAVVARKGVAPFIDEARSLIKEGLVKGTSIGFQSLDDEPVDENDPWGGTKFNQWAWLEHSIVTIPANADCNIMTIRSFDIAQEKSAASGQKTPPAGVVRLKDAPGASGRTAPASKPTQKGSDPPMSTNAEQVAAYEAKRQASVARMSAIVELWDKEGRTATKEEDEEYETLKQEVTTCDKHLARLKEHQTFLTTTAQPVDPKVNGGAGASADTTAGTVAAQQAASAGVIHGFRPNSNLPKGIAFTRYCIALANGKGDTMRTLETCKRWKDSTPEVLQAVDIRLKTAVAAGTSTDTTWAGPLVPLMPMQQEFIEFLYPMTIVGRIPGFRVVPFNIKVPRQTAMAASSKWVGQDAPKPLSKLAFDTLSLGTAKISTIVVLTEELVRFSNPSAELLVRNDLAEAISKYMDGQFIDPNVSAVVNVSPASVTNGATLINATGITLDSVTTDVAAVFNEFSSNNVPLVNAMWVMNPRTATHIGMIRTGLGVFAFPNINVNGGEFFGFPVITSQNVPISAVSAGETIAVLLKPPEILMADDGQITVDLSNEASVEMSDSPTGGATSLVSFWQNNLVGLRAERFINWLPRRSHVVAVWDGLQL